MARDYRVVDCRTDMFATAEIYVMAETPEHAALLVIREALVRGSTSGGPLRAKVYFTSPKGGTKTMVRLYAQIADSQGVAKPG